MIAFETDQGPGDNIAVINLDGTGYRLLTKSGLDDRDPAWSPDGRKLAFYRKNGNDTLYTINLDGTGLTKLTSASDLADPMWNPRTGNQIVFEINNRIHIINSNGSGLTKLTSGGEHDDPVWNPQGTRLVYEGGNSNTINIINSNGTGNRRLAPPNTLDVYWSPDGKKIVYEKENVGIFLINPDGTGNQLLTDMPSDDFDPQWMYTGMNND